ncbi:ATP-binding cassette domain-containing protein [Streptomyces chartreusis]|uniref:Stage 0 sporulation protein KE n=1 Tax=Streptomyces chartreusis NRRL 3882 TaxID=1079985 RepID=A0A2N9BLF9_STRCX|nr:ATP-binding cassette domain-containing protein [Streptomyces sp. SID5464]SOR84200.1 Stage 0 sporulation protein KE [Streptomyces chartreusis NRRL 3882]
MPEDLMLGRGETLGLVGESGCGKSTLARVLLRLERPGAGTVRYEGVGPFTLSGAELLAWRRKVQMVFRTRSVAQPPAARGGSDRRALADPPRSRPRVEAGGPRAELLEMVGLRASDAGRHPHEFSGGQRQRLNLLCDLRDELGLSWDCRTSSSRTTCPWCAPRRPRRRDVPRQDRGDGPDGVPAPADPPSGCRFRTPCRRVRDVCAEAVPAPPPPGPVHGAACHFPLEETPPVTV